MIRGDIEVLLGRGALPRSVQLALVLEIVSTYTRVRWLLWRTDIAAVVHRIRHDAVQSLDADSAVRLGRRLSRPVQWTLDPLPWDSRCLMRALVLIALLSRRGMHGTLVIGVKRDDDFSAHAWVEYGDVPLLPPGDHHPLTRI